MPIGPGGTTGTARFNLRAIMPGRMMERAMTIVRGAQSGLEIIPVKAGENPQLITIAGQSCPGRDAKERAMTDSDDSALALALAPTPLFQPKMAEIRRLEIVTRNTLGFCGKQAFQPTFQPPSNPLFHPRNQGLEAFTRNTLGICGK